MSGSTNMKKAIYKNPGLSVLVHWGICLAAIICFILYAKQNISALLWVGVAAIVVLCLSIALSFFTWNPKVYFDDQTISYRVLRRRYVWKWTDISDCEVKLRFHSKGNPYSVCFLFHTVGDMKKLMLEYSVNREKILVDICPIEELKQKMKNNFHLED